MCPPLGDCVGGRPASSARYAPPGPECKQPHNGSCCAFCKLTRPLACLVHVTFTGCGPTRRPASGPGCALQSRERAAAADGRRRPAGSRAARRQRGRNRRHPGNRRADAEAAAAIALEAHRRVLQGLAAVYSEPQPHPGARRVGDLRGWRVWGRGMCDVLQVLAALYSEPQPHPGARRVGDLRAWRLCVVCSKGLPFVTLHCS